MKELVEIEPGRWRFIKATPAPARSSLPCPYVISDEMPPTEQVDGMFYTSKAKFRAIGRALGLTEVGNEKPKLKTARAPESRASKAERRRALERAIAQYKQGRRARRHRAGMD
jgi:hypothetical protein